MPRAWTAALAALALALGGAAPAAAAPSTPSPHYAKRCGLIAKGSRDYRVWGRAVRCRFARRWVRRYLRSRREAPGFSCVDTSSGDSPFTCTKGRVKAYWAERL